MEEEYEMYDEEYRKKKELILKELDVKSLWHVTDFINLESILEHGLLSRNDCKAKGIEYIDSSNQEAHREKETWFRRGLKKRGKKGNE